MRPPCDEAIIRSGSIGSPGKAEARTTWILAATIIGSSMAFIDSTVVNVALPALQANFHATVVDVQWVVESYGLFLAALILVGGSLGDLFGRRLIFVLGVAIFAVASVGCGAASNIHQLIIAQEHSRRRSRTSRAWEPGDYQCILRRGKPRSGDRHVVRLYGNHDRGRARSGRLAGRSMLPGAGYFSLTSRWQRRH